MSTLVNNLKSDLTSRQFWQDNGTIVVLIAFIIMATLLSGGIFIRPSNLATILYQGSIIGVLVLGQTMVVLVGGLDLSIVAVLILSAIIMGGAGSERQAMMSMGALPYIGFAPALIAGFVVAGLSGLLNGLMVTRLHIPAFITTLATALFLGGIILLVTGGSPIYYPDPFYPAFGESKFLGLPAPIFVFVGLASIFWWILNQTPFGKKIYAIGGSERASAYSGISVSNIRLLVYTVCGLTSGLAGFLFLSRTGYVSYASGGELLMTTIAALVVGGVSLAGGIGGVKHAVAGVLLLASLSNFMNIMLISPYIQNAVNGLVILVAVSVYSHINAEKQ